MRLAEIDVYHLEIRCPSCKGTMQWMVGRQSSLSICCHCDAVLRVDLVVKTKVNNVLLTADVRAYQEVGAASGEQLPSNVRSFKNVK